MSFSPFLPAVPNPTPTIATNGRRAQRAPIFNPYDKFTAPEFDAWIGDITGALKRALGREPEEPEEDAQEDHVASRDVSGNHKVPEDAAQREGTDEESEGESVMEDSFAHLVTRRANAKAKGKARDPREGPGLGDGRRDQPIEILSDSDANSYQEEDVEVEESLHGEGEREGRWHDRRREYDEYDEGEEEEGEYYEEDSQEEEEEEWGRPGASQSRRKVDYGSEDDGDEEVLVEVHNAGSDDEEVVEVSSVLASKAHPESNSAEVDQDDGLNYVLGFNPPASDQIESDEDEDASEFPPPRGNRASPSPEIPDPWEGPRTFAEDFYSGGDLPISAVDGLTPNHLTPAALSPALADGDEDFSITPGVLSGDDDEVGVAITPGVLSPIASEHGILNVDLDDVQGKQEHEIHERDELQEEQGDLYADIPDITVHPSPPATSLVDADRELAPSPATPHTLVQPPSTPPRPLSAFTPTPIRPAKPRTPASRTPVVHERNKEREAEWDWNYPPAFNGRVADRPGHLASNGDDALDFHVRDASDEKEDDIQVDGEEDEEEDPDVWGAMPLGTSDLDIREWGRDANEHEEERASGDEQEHHTSPTQYTTPRVPSPEIIDLDAEVVPQQTLQLADEDSFGDLPSSTSPTPAIPQDTDRPNPYDVQRREIEKLFADLDRLPEPPAETYDAAEVARLTDTLLGASTLEHGRRNAWVSEELEGTDVDAEDLIPDDIPGYIFSELTDAVPTEATTDSPYIVEESHMVWLDGVLLDDGFGEVASVGPSEVGRAGTAEMREYIVEEPEPSQSTQGGETTSQQIPDLPPSDSIAPDGPEASESPSKSVEVREASPKPQPVVETSERPGPPTSPLQAPVELPIPAPVSADPSVPDPASPKLSASVSDGFVPSAESLPAVPAFVFRAFELDGPRRRPGAAGSGLFTPIGGVEDGTPTPSEDSDVAAADAPSETVVDEEAAPIVSSGNEVSNEENAQRSPEEEVVTQIEEQTKVPLEEKSQVPIEEAAVTYSEDATGSSEQEPNVPGPTITTEIPVDFFVPPFEDPAHDRVEPANALPEEVAEGDQDALSVPPDDLRSAPAAVRGKEVVGSASLLPGDHGSSIPGGSDDQLVDLVLTYPEAPSSASNLDTHLDTDDAGTEADADGEADPDYPPTPAANGELDEMDPFRLMGSDSKLAPGPVANDEPSSSEQSTPAVDEVETTSPPYVLADVEPPIEITEGKTGAPKTSDTAPVSAQSPTGGQAGVKEREEQADSSESEAALPARLLKRKRTSPSISIPPRVTRSKSAIDAKGNKRAGSLADNKRRAKGKGKAIRENTTDGDSADDSASEAESQAEYLKPHPRRRAPASRAESVGSTASMASSVQSPTLALHHPAQTTLPPLMHGHKHSFIHHHHGRPAAPPAALPPPVSQAKTPATSRSVSVELQSASPSSQLPSPLKRLPSMNSPVTRSNCRFHKISLPREEGGPRVSFVVPGCSLGDGELMQEQEVEDHGFATMEDHQRMIPDIEALDFNSYLIGVLRQLVGVDLLREQEIFYLPNPGEDMVRRKKKSRKSAVDKLRLSQRQSMTSADVRSLVGRSSSRPSEGSRRSVTPSQDLLSARDAGSVAGSSARLRNGGSGRGSSSTVSGSVGAVSDLDDDQEPKVKRRKTTPAVEDDRASVTAGTSASAIAPGRDDSISSQPTKPRRSKRRGLHVDAAAYKPDEDAEEEDVEEPSPKERRVKGARRGGTKRVRTMDEVPSGIPKAKKTRLRKSVSTPLGQGTNGTEQAT